ncbi:MAG: LPS export ABC transporter periplasmic protein LptC [Cyclobacteriaceae bacterium]|nr:LPS export ABC transporter periplasmic protein LptC [Cyclobacteriaceae bacterium]
MRRTNYRLWRILSFSTILLLVINGCGNKDADIKKVEEYTGPIVELGSATTYYSDSAVVKMKMDAPRQLELGNGDREFPEGLHIEFFDLNGVSTSTLRANYCYYTSKEDLYKATGNVVIINTLTGDRLDTEELFWNRSKETVFTDKFVKIEKDGELQMGDGLDAKQDFSSWRLIKYRGTMDLKGQQYVEFWSNEAD